MKNNEIWRPVAGYEELYEVSNLGRVRSIGWNNLPHYCGGVRKRKGVILIPSKTGPERNYMRVQLCREGTVVRSRIHRLVARAFPEICGEWFEGCEIDHIDGVKDNNKATNLKICTKSENMRNPLTIIKISNLRKKPVLQYTQNGEFIREWDSASTAANELSISRSTILISLKGGNTRKYKWVYKEDNLCV